MKLVYLSTSIIPSRSANSVHVMRMCQAFTDNGHDVELLAPEHEKTSVETAEVFSTYAVRQNFRLTKIRRSKHKWGAATYAYAAARYAKSVQPELVYGRAIRACLLAALRGLPVVLEIHDLTYIRSRAVDRFAFSTLLRTKTFRYVVVISHALARDLVSMYPSLERRILVAHDGADPVVNEASATEQKHDGETLRVGYVGSIYPGRGVDLLSAIAQRLPWLELHIVGDWADGTDPDASARALPANIHVHGFLPYADAERMRIACDVLLAPYQRRVFTRGGSNTSRWMSPLKIFEYMAAAKAIVCSDLEVLHEVLDHEKTVLFCPPDDVDAWCAAITKLREDDQLRQRLGSAAQSAFLQHYTRQARAEAVLKAPEPSSAA